jgi:ADP-ribosyl-[dinitrogen reductase] hydrolase
MFQRKPPKAPICPECSSQMRPTSYGMRAYNPADDGFYDMGCMMDEDRAKFGCPTCHYLIYESGKTRNPAADRALGSILGLAIGDALGAPYEFKPPVTDETPITMDYNDNWTPGMWTDDTAMAIAIMQAWVKHGNITSTSSQDELVKIWKEWSQTAPDCGVQTRQVLSMLTEETAEEARLAAEAVHVATSRSGGNGSLMRTAPLAFLRLPDAEVAKIVTQISKLTHYDDDAAHACIIWVFAIRHAIRTGELDFDAGFEFLPPEAKTKWHGFLQEAQENPPVHFENNGWVVAAFKAAASAVMIGQYSYTKGIEAAIRAGFDTDTVAAIAGSLLGALSGALYLPEEWKGILHGWPGSTSQDLVNLTVQTLEVRP